MSDFTAAVAGVRVSLATAAFAGLAAAGQPVPIEAMWGGVKLVHIGFGSVGAAITISVVQDWSWSTVFLTLITGLSLAALGTPIVLHYVDLPADIAGIGESAMATVLGLVGVYIIPAIHNGAKAVRANPWGFVDWLRGRGAAPTPPNDPGKGGAP